jgi:hypothetical protein
LAVASFSGVTVRFLRGDLRICVTFTPDC